MKPYRLLLILMLILITTSSCTLVVSRQPPQATQAAASPQIVAETHLPTLPPLPPSATPTRTPKATASAVDGDVLPEAVEAGEPVATENASARRQAEASLEDTQAEERDPSAAPEKGEPTPLPQPVLLKTSEPSASTSPAAEATATPAGEDQSVTSGVPAVSPTSWPTLAAPTPTATEALPEPTVEALEPLTIAFNPESRDPNASGCPAPTVGETTLSLNTYDYQAALVPTAPDDMVYPYPRLNHDRVGAPAPQSYRAVVLENCYLQLTLLPDLGGRIYRWIDKRSGQNLFYQNPVIKPTQWGHRGWWLATGGMEWALPVDEHGLSEASPWSYTLYQDGQTAGVVLNDTEERSGLVSEVMISLDAGHAYFTLAPRIVNPTGAPIAYKFWINGMFSLGSPQPKAGIEFVLPGNQVTIHSTGDPSLPGENQTMDWPIFAGRSMNDYGAWNHYLGFFAAPSAQAGYMGAYNHSTDLGVARVFPHLIAHGAKIFGPATLDPKLWTDDGSSYFELWGGLAPTFADMITLNPGDWIAWQERWYAVGNIGGFNFANEEAALKLKPLETMVQVGAATTSPIEGYLVLSQNGAEITRWPVALTPEQPFQDNFISSGPPKAEGWGLTLIDQNGQMIATTGQALSPLVVSPSGAPAASGAQPAALHQVEAPPATPIPPTPEQVTLPPTPVIITVTPSPTFTPSPTLTATPVVTVPATPSLTATPLSSAGGEQIVWDPRLDPLGIKLNRAQAEPGQMVYRLVEARYQDDQESNGLHHVFVEVIDENGQRIVGQPVALTWKDGQNRMVTEDKPAPEYAANAPLYGEMADGTYEVYVEGEPSDKVSGLGLPGKHHVNYLLTFQRRPATPAEPTRVSPYPISTTPTPAVTPTPTASSGTNPNGVLWDPRLDELGVKLTQAQPQPGQPVYRLVAAHYRDAAEAQGLHHVFVEVVDENGLRLVGQPVALAWGNDKAILVTENKPIPEYAANAPLYGALPDATYRVSVDGAPSDVVEGIGLPGKHHVSFWLTFQRKSN